MTKKVFTFFFCLIISQAFAQNRARITETMQKMETYPFSDPNPIPNPESSFYPYFRFDGFALQSEQQEWKVVTLENSYIKLSVFPEIGGKIWGAVEKSTGNEFLYHNSVVKFRDIAMRGAWTSGGIELNFGVIGHAPTCATPVDYQIVEKDDGSVSCVVGAYELLTRTRWETEINLQKDKAYFTTTTRWQNPTPLVQPYYQWMNAAYQVKGDLEFCFPGSHWIGHDGRSHNWPIDPEGRDVSYYRNNSFGGSKSNHVLGGISDHYAGYWHDLEFGSGHYTAYGDKLGMKVFQWAHSRSGGIWEDLLTDTDGQYVELQSGRLFNQAATGSTLTPFKHFGFEPYAMDEFKEYWFPILNTRGVKKANPFGVLNVESQGSEQVIFFCPLQKTKEQLSIYVGTELVQQKDLDLDVLQTWSEAIKLDDPDKPLKIVLGAGKLVYSTDKQDNISNRPMNTPDDFDWNSTYGLFLAGQHWLYQNKYELAEESFAKCLSKDAHYAPALNQLSALSYRKGVYEEGIKYAAKSLAIDTYDAEANFIYALNNKRQGNLLDAEDGFSVASMSPSFRIASYIELAKLALQKGDMLTAKMYAERVVHLGPDNPEGIKLASLIGRKSGERIMEMSAGPGSIVLDHFGSYELMLSSGQMSSEDFAASVQSELPQETFMEMALWYEESGSRDDAIRLLELSPPTAMVLFRLAYLKDLDGKSEEAQEYLKKAVAISADFVLPFRAESLPVLEWAVENNDSWKPRFYLALLQWSFGDKTSTKNLLSQCGQEPDAAAFYMARSAFFENFEDYDIEEDLLKAHTLAPGEWRTSSRLIDYYLSTGEVEKALNIAQQGIQNFPDNNLLKYSYARCLLANEQYKACKDALAKTYILPSEGARYGRVTYRQACLMQALQSYGKNRYSAAQESIADARLWPENLGVGRPFVVDERIENYIEALCLIKKNKKKQGEQLFEEIISFNQSRTPRYHSVDYLYVMSLNYLDRKLEAEQFLSAWETSEPDDQLLKWCKSMLDGDTDTAASIASDINTKSGGTPWDPITGDPDFEIIKSLAMLTK